MKCILMGHIFCLICQPSMSTPPGVNFIPGWEQTLAPSNTSRAFFQCCDSHQFLSSDYPPTSIDLPPHPPPNSHHCPPHSLFIRFLCPHYSPSASSYTLLSFRGSRRLAPASFQAVAPETRSSLR